MICLLFVGDGDRDAAMLPPLVANALGAPVSDDHGNFKAWHNLRFHKSKGYARKLRYAMRLAVDAGSQGVIAVVDRDTEKKGRRLRQLRDARAADRDCGLALPMALGEASPHGEAWLLDDQKAVRSGLGLEANAPIPSVTKTKDPKDALQNLIEGSPRSGERTIELIKKIAENIDPNRCTHAKVTGFEAFAQDVKAELGPLVAAER